MAGRPVVLCRSACEIVEDRVGNSVLVLSIASQRLLVARTDVERRRLIVMIRRHAERLEALHQGLTPCDRCGGCSTPVRGRYIDELA